MKTVELVHPAVYSQCCSNEFLIGVGEGGGVRGGQGPARNIILRM